VAWTSVKESFGREFKVGVNGATGTRVFRCVSDTKIRDISLASVADDGVTALPILGASWPAGGANTTGLKVFDIEPQEVGKEQKTYDVAISYATEESKDQFTSNPSNRDWQVRWGTEWVEEVPYGTLTNTTAAGIVSSFPSGGAAFTVTGIATAKPIVNAVLDKLAAVDRRAVQVCTLQKYYTPAQFAALGPGPGSNYGLKALSTFIDTCNDAVLTLAGLTSAGIYTLLMDDITVENGTENGYDYISVSYRIVYDPYTQSNILMNAGFRRYAAAGGAGGLIQVLGADGKDTSDAQALNDDGTQSGAAQPRIYYAFGVKKSTTWSSLGLPTVIPT
jgi:hypothetical protein